MNLAILENVPLASYTTLKLGGVARYFVEVKTHEELQAAYAFAAKQQIPYVVVGGGSNLLVSDAGYSGLVIKQTMLGMTYVDVNDTTVELQVAAGEVFDEVVADTVKQGYWGLENLSSIPGTVGATPIQNVGAYGVEVKEIITKVEVYDGELDEFRYLTNEECQFGYRDSLFKSEEGKRYIVTAVHFRLSKEAKPQLAYRDLAMYFKDCVVTSPETIRRAVVEIRSHKFPDWHVLGTAGSFFKNPIVSREVAIVLADKYPELPMYEVGEHQMKLSLGYVLDKICSLKGYRQGAVGLYEAQALVLVNYGGATTTEVNAFVEDVQMKVYDKIQIKIEMEVRRIGE